MAYGYDSVVHDIGRDSDTGKILLAFIANNGGSVSEAELEETYLQEWGETIYFMATELAHGYENRGWLNYSGGEYTLTNMGWAIVDGANIQSQLEALGEGEVWADYVDRWTPIFVYSLPDTDYTVNTIDEVIRDAAYSLDTEASASFVQSELPFEPSWLIGFE